MKRKLLTVLIIVFFISSVAFGQGYLKDIKVAFRDIKLMVNDKDVTKGYEPFIFNNKVHAPVRDIVNAMGGEVYWDDKNNKVIINDYKSIKECNYLNGESFVYGLVTDINHEEKTINIEQHFDDNSVLVTPMLKSREDVVILLKRNDKYMNLDFNDLVVGEDIGIILDRNNLIRGIIISK